MDKRIIKGLIDEKLEVIQEQFSIIKAYEGKIPIIELDLIMTSIRDLYELVLSLQIENMGSVLQKASSQSDSHGAMPSPPPVTIRNLKEEMAEAVVEAVEKPVEEEVPPAAEPQVTGRISSSFISMEPIPEEEPIKESPPEEEKPVAPEPPVTSYEQADSSYEQPSSPEPVVQVNEEHDPDQPHEKYQRITFDLFSESGGSTLADRLREGQEKRIADKLQENKVVDLRTSIGINDKFLFINELFEGNMGIYDEAIQKLNSSTAMAQADMLLLDLKIAYNWDSEAPSVKKFVELVRRKF